VPALKWAKRKDGEVGREGNRRPSFVLREKRRLVFRICLIKNRERTFSMVLTGWPYGAGNFSSLNTKKVKKTTVWEEGGRGAIRPRPNKIKLVFMSSLHQHNGENQKPHLTIVIIIQFLIWQRIFTNWTGNVVVLIIYLYFELTFRFHFTAKQIYALFKMLRHFWITPSWTFKKYMTFLIWGERDRVSKCHMWEEGLKSTQRVSRIIWIPLKLWANFGCCSKHVGVILTAG
jgi:hypothetical protein